MRLTDYAITHNLTPFVSMQNHYNIAYREEEREMLPMLKHLGVGVIPWSPLARGATTRPLADTTDRAKTDPCVFELFIIATGRSLIQSRTRSWHDFYLQDGSGGKEIVNRYVTCLSL